MTQFFEHLQTERSILELMRYDSDKNKLFDSAEQDKHNREILTNM